MFDRDGNLIGKQVHAPVAPGAKPMRVHVDGDSLAYASAFAPTLEEMQFTARRYLDDILQATGAQEMVGYVENPHGKMNFRKWVSMSAVYKGNRTGKKKPDWLLQAKQFLCSEFGFKYATYMESEDRVAIEAAEYGWEWAWIAMLDKDLLTVPGRFYNYAKKECFTVSEGVANVFLARQMLCGDSGDNIGGIPGISTGYADKILALRTSDEAQHLWELVARAYLKDEELWLRVLPPKKNGDMQKKFVDLPKLTYLHYIETARLVRILRARNDVFTPLSPEEWAELEAQV